MKALHKEKMKGWSWTSKSNAKVMIVGDETLPLDVDAAGVEPACVGLKARPS